jgi:hypothetical protein
MQKKPLLIKSKNFNRLVTEKNLNFIFKSSYGRMISNIKNSMFFGLGSIAVAWSVLSLQVVPLSLWLCVYFMLIPCGISIQNIFSAILVNHFGAEMVFNQKNTD